MSLIFRTIENWPAQTVMIPQTQNTQNIMLQQYYTDINQNNQRNTYHNKVIIFQPLVIITETVNLSTWNSLYNKDKDKSWQDYNCKFSCNSGLMS